MRTRRLAPLFAFVAVLIVALPANAVTVQKVVDTRSVDEVGLSLATGWTVWSQNSPTHPKAWTGWVMPDGSAATKIRFNGDVAVGNVITDGPRANSVVFWTEGGKGDVRFYDLGTKTVTKAPAGVNTTKPEYEPFVSGDNLVFSRVANSSTQNVILYSFSTKKFTTIATGWHAPTGISGDYVVYQACTQKTCNVWRYQISTRRTVKMPAAPTGRANYWAGVGSDGAVYYVQGSNAKCGKNTKILRYANGHVTTIWTAPDGTELGALQVDDVNGAPILALGELDCAKQDWGAYKIAL